VTRERYAMPFIELPAILVASKDMEEAGREVNAARPKAERESGQRRFANAQPFARRERPAFRLLVGVRRWTSPSYPPRATPIVLRSGL